MDAADLGEEVSPEAAKISLHQHDPHHSRKSRGLSQNNLSIIKTQTKPATFSRPNLTTDHNRSTHPNKNPTANSPNPHLLQSPTMPKPRRNLQATAEETMTPPPSLTSTQSLARVLQAAGNNLYRVELPASSTLASETSKTETTSKTLLVELPARFRSTIWIKRGGFVLVDTAAAGERENKLDGEIVNVVRNEKEWRKEKYWPNEFVQRISYADEDDSDEEESNVGRMPPSDSEDE